MARPADCDRQHAIALGTEMGNAAAVAKAFQKLHQGVAIPYYEKLLDQGYSRLVERGHTVFDVGAHSGLHLDRFVTLVGAQGRVFAFEPIPRFARYLAARYRGNGSVTVRPIALADKAGSAAFKVVEGALEQSGLRERNLGAVRRSDGRTSALAARLANGMLQRTGLNRHVKRRPVAVRDIVVDVDTIDAQAAPLERLDYIKIDVEGGEMNCLRGAQGAVQRHRPFISVEYGRSSYTVYGETALSLFEWSQQNRYLLSDLFGNLIEDESEWLQVCDTAYWDFFLLPQERREFWISRFQV